MPYGSTNPDDEDFRSRYPAETMPSNLATVASNNLATQDAATTKVNAAGRLAALPGVGAPGSTPTTDATNLSVAAAMDRGDLADRIVPFSASATTAPTLNDTRVGDIVARRSAIADQKQQLMSQLAVTGIDDTKRRNNILSTWHTLDTEDRNLLTEHHYNAIDAARTAHENLARETHIAAANDFASMSNDLLDLQKNPNIKPGTPEFSAAALEIAKNHPQGFQTQAGQTLYRGIAQTHDAAATLEDRSYWQRFGQAFKEASVVARKVGGDVQYDDQGFPSIALTGAQKSSDGQLDPETADKELYNAYGIRQTNLVNPQSVRVVGTPKSTDPGDVNGNFVEVKTLAKGQPTTVYLPKSDYLKFGGKLADATGPAPALAPEDKAAIDWANANPKDPRAIAIKKLHGIQ
jgi:hypothetical protein